jgi:predicted lipoprotein with Yx(FWY)xxD motif
VIRASRAAYLVCGVLTALALAGWGVRAAGTPQNNTASKSSVALNPPAAAAPNAAGGAGAYGDQNNGQSTDQNNGQSTDQNNGQSTDQANGQGSQPTGANPTDVTTKLTATKVAKMGDVVTIDNGHVLYRFDKDTVNKPSTCADKCSAVWHAVTTADGNVPQLDGIDPSLVTMIKRPDGVMQVALHGWNLYTYIGDVKAGTWKGQSVGGVWFVSDHQGKKNLTCVPTSPPVAVQPPTANIGGGGTRSGGGDNIGGGTY